MRTNIEIDDDLMNEAMRTAKTRTKKETVEAALKLLVQTRAQARLRRWRGKIKWEGNLEESRQGRVAE
jgi:Arc/MetJ family transcription regulator